MKALIIGASAGLGRALAEALASRGHDLAIVASDQRDLDAIASDLRLRFGVVAHPIAMDLTDLDIDRLRDGVHCALGDIDNLFIIAGFTDPLDRGAVGDSQAERIMAVNFTSAVRILNGFLAEMADRKGGNIIGAGSVASVRGRRSNAIYGASKRGLEGYFEAIRHHLAASECRVQFYRLGYLETRMTFGQKLMFPPLTPAETAERIITNLGKDLGSVYLPWWWRGIGLLFQMLPWSVFRRLDL
tara:strand:- start:2306 stop:3037 length:732 start_codon:yes stop_codon:yes gene_type:complete